MKDFEELKSTPIKKAYFVKFGPTSINRFKTFIEFARKRRIRNIYEVPRYLDEQYIKDVEDCFDSSLSVLNWEKILIYKSESLSTAPDLENSMITSQFLGYSYHLKLTLPIRKQRSVAFGSSIFGKEKLDFSEEFNIVYDGVHYLYYRECNPFKLAHEGAIDARDELNKILKHKFDLIRLAPNPVRQDFIFIIPKKRVKSISPIINGNAHYFVIEDPSDIKQFFVRMLRNESILLRQFYKGTYFTETLERIRNSFKSEYSKIFNLVAELQKTSWIALIKRDKIHNDIKEKFSVLYRLIGDYINFEEVLFKNKKDFDEQIKNSIFFVIKKELEVDYEYHKLNYDAFLQTFQTIRNNIEDYQKSRHLGLTVLASVISAIIGGIISGFLIK